MGIYPLPYDLWDLIVRFGYGVALDGDFFTDLSITQLQQLRIPSLFLKETFPLRYAHDLGPMAPDGVRYHSIMMDYAPKNPFKKGYPYFPTAGLNLKNYNVFNAKLWGPLTFLSHEGCRKCQTFPGHVKKRVKFIHDARIYDWHRILSFLRRESLVDLTCYTEVNEYVLDFVKTLNQNNINQDKVKECICDMLPKFDWVRLNHLAQNGMIQML